MHLSYLINDEIVASLIVSRWQQDCDILDISHESFRIGPGFMFVALPGSRIDGRCFIDEAIARGAVAILVPTDTILPSTITETDVIIIETHQPHRCFAHLAARFYGVQPRHIVAVTGTNGKTSTVHFTRQLWLTLNKPSASLGTLGLITPEQYDRTVLPTYVRTDLTTPDPITVHSILKTLSNHNIEHVAIEASSHGLAQYRIDGIHLCAAGFTNLTHDHLDYHQSFQAYCTAKERLFAEILPSDGCAVLNADTLSNTDLLSICQTRGQQVITYGHKGQELILHAWEAQPDGQQVTIEIFGTIRTIKIPLIGLFQVSNALCALGLVIGAESLDAAQQAKAIDALERLEAPPGRLQQITKLANGAPIYVDYAHTPAALEAVLTALRPHVRRRLIVVFGCGGDRDQAKRPLMGQIANQLADAIVVTDDNPRHESPDVIRQAILRTATKAIEIGNRECAIRTAIHTLKTGDVLLVAGKGHETNQIIGDISHPCDDQAIIHSIVAQQQEYGVL